MDWRKKCVEGLSSCIAAAKAAREKISLALLANVKGITSRYTDYSENSIATEFLSIEELEALLCAARDCGFYTTPYFDIQDFITQLNDLPRPSIPVVFDTTQKGIGRGKDSLVPALCNIYNLINVGPNAFAAAICSNKFIWTKYLEQAGFPVPSSRRFSSGGKWLPEAPPITCSLIAKPIYECASIGVSQQSIGKLSTKYLLFLEKQSRAYRQPLIVQEFIEGYEVEVPVILCRGEFLILPPIGISVRGTPLLAQKILSFQDIYQDDYEFYDFENVMPKEAGIMRNLAAQTLNYMEVDAYARVDFRVTKSGLPFIIDVNIYPHIVHHSSFAYAFKLLGLNPQIVIAALVGNALLNYHSSKHPSKPEGH